MHTAAKRQDDCSKACEDVAQHGDEVGIEEMASDGKSGKDARNYGGRTSHDSKLAECSITVPEGVIAEHVLPPFRVCPTVNGRYEKGNPISSEAENDPKWIEYTDAYPAIRGIALGSSGEATPWALLELVGCSKIP